jgi:hypothetical protein
MSCFSPFLTKTSEMRSAYPLALRINTQDFSEPFSPYPHQQPGEVTDTLIPDFEFDS